MSSFHDLEVLNDFDEMQRYIMREDVIKSATELMIEYNANPVYAKHYLSSMIFFKFQDEFPNLKESFKTIIEKVYHKVDLNINIPIFVDFFNEWKKKDINTTLENLNMMKRQTRASSSETDNEDCKKCLENQEQILTVAENFYKSMQKNS